MPAVLVLGLQTGRRQGAPLPRRAICMCWALRECPRAAQPHACRALGVLGAVGEVVAGPEAGGLGRPRWGTAGRVLPLWREQMHLGPALPPAELSFPTLGAWWGRAGAPPGRASLQRWHNTQHPEASGEGDGGRGPDSPCDGVTPALPQASVSPSGKQGSYLF